MSLGSGWFDNILRRSGTSHRSWAKRVRNDGSIPSEVTGRRVETAAAGPMSTEGHRLYVLPDMHGRIDALDDALDRIGMDVTDRPSSDAMLICLGDYVDRGDHSADVIQRLIDVSTRWPVVCLKGNHEALLLAALHNPQQLAAWTAVGGLSTLMSYDVVPSLRPSAAAAQAMVAAFERALPDGHRAFLGSLRPSFRCGSYFFAHAGIRPGVDLDHQAEDDLLWIRDRFLSSDADHEKRIVHGHTVVNEPEIRANRIGLDTGAYVTGRLSCLVLEDDDLRLI